MEGERIAETDPNMDIFTPTVNRGGCSASLVSAAAAFFSREVDMLMLGIFPRP